MLSWLTRQPDPSTLAAIEDVNDDIRLLASEERLLRQELGLPPITPADEDRWTLEAPTSARSLLSRPRQGRGRSIVALGVKVSAAGAAAAAAWALTPRRRRR